MRDLLGRSRDLPVPGDRFQLLAQSTNFFGNPEVGIHRFYTAEVLVNVTGQENTTTSDIRLWRLDATERQPSLSAGV